VVDPLAAWKQKGTIVVGVRIAAAPFSTLDENHNFVGYEPDIARAVAAALGVKARFVAVDDSNAHDFLKRGVVDFLILPRGGIEPHDPMIRYIQPGYFASGFNAVALREGSLKAWEDLKGQPVCGLQTSVPAKQIIEELGGSFIGFADRNTALQALTAERCSAFISDEVALREALKNDVDHRFTMAFGTIDVAPWTIAVRSADIALGDFIGDRLADFHRTGFLIKQAGVWKLPSNPYLESMHQNYKQ
jgi:polar amino acid transport system substrate-binding protein